MNIWKSGIMGVVVGDALGCPVQFESRAEVAKHPVMEMRGYGTFNLPAGSWTDDSSLTLALLESIQRTGGIDYKDIMDNFVKWLDDGEFTPYGYSYDIGRGTMSAINRYKRYHKPHKAGNIDERSNGNGSLMRIMPAVLYCCDHQLPAGESIDIIHKVGGLTHAHIFLRNCSVGVDEKRYGNGIGFVRFERFTIGIKEYRETEMAFLNDLICGFEGFSVAIGQVDHQNLYFVSSFDIEVFKHLHFFQAVGAPACPKVDNCRLAGKVG